MHPRAAVTFCVAEATPRSNCLCGWKDLISHLPGHRGKSNEQIAHHSIDPGPPKKPKPLVCHTNTASLVETIRLLLQLILNMKMTNPFYSVSARQGPPFKGAAVAAVARTAAAQSAPHFLWLQLQVPPGQVGSFLNLWPLLAGHPGPHLPAAHHPLWVALLGLPGSVSQSQAGDRQQASFINQPPALYTTEGSYNYSFGPARGLSPTPD